MAACVMAWRNENENSIRKLKRLVSNGVMRRGVAAKIGVKPA